MQKCATKSPTPYPSEGISRNATSPHRRKGPVATFCNVYQTAEVCPRSAVRGQGADMAAGLVDKRRRTRAGQSVPAQPCRRPAGHRSPPAFPLSVSTGQNLEMFDWHRYGAAVLVVLCVPADCAATQQQQKQQQQQPSAVSITTADELLALISRAVRVEMRPAISKLESRIDAVDEKIKSRLFLLDSRVDDHTVENSQRPLGPQVEDLNKKLELLNSRVDRPLENSQSPQLNELSSRLDSQQSQLDELATFVPRPSAALSPVLLAGGSYDRRSDVFSAGPLSTSAAPSRISCAAWCDRTTGCVGFTLTAGGSCQLFDSLLDAGADASVGVPVDYVTRRGQPCPPGLLLYRDSCYIRQPVGVGNAWQGSRSVCQSFADKADLFTPKDETDAAWLAYHPSRPAFSEYLGLKIQNGVFLNLDGTTNPIQLDLKASHVNTGCVNTVWQYGMTPAFNSHSCTRQFVNGGYICESPLLCRFGTPCPPGWMSLDNYCYHYVSDEKTWQEADDHCAGLQQGARLSPVINMGTWRILYQQFGSSGSAIWVGLSDSASEGSFQATDGADWSVTWADGAPGGQDEDCVRMTQLEADDVSCQQTLPSICRVLITAC